MLAVAILAAGESRRMGKPKALLDYQGRTFVENLIDATRHSRVGTLRVVLGARAEEIRAQLRSVDPASIVVNADWQSGQLSSIHAAIRSLPEGDTEALMLCPVDHPLISPALVARLIEAFDTTQRSIVLPVHKGRRGHPVIFRADLYEELLKASPEVGARQVVWAQAEDVFELLTEDQGVILNIDDPAAYRNALQRTPGAEQS